MKLLARFNSSLTYPIAATLVLVTAVPVALVGFDLARYNREVLTTKERKTLTRQAVSLANEATMYLAANKSRLDGITRTLKIIPVAEAEVRPSYSVKRPLIPEEPSSTCKLPTARVTVRLFEIRN